jgi:hypothetical protein
MSGFSSVAVVLLYTIPFCLPFHSAQGDSQKAAVSIRFITLRPVEGNIKRSNETKEIALVYITHEAVS